jgi:hypothetical protein
MQVSSLNLTFSCPASLSENRSHQLYHDSSTTCEKHIFFLFFTKRLASLFSQLSLKTTYIFVHYM